MEYQRIGIGERPRNEVYPPRWLRPRTAEVYKRQLNRLFYGANFTIETDTITRTPIVVLGDALQKQHEVLSHLPLRWDQIARYEVWAITRHHEEKPL